MLKIFDGIFIGRYQIFKEILGERRSRTVTKQRNNGRGARTMDGRGRGRTGDGPEKKRNAGRMKKGVREREKAS